MKLQYEGVMVSNYRLPVWGKMSVDVLHSHNKQRDEYQTHILVVF